MIRRRSRTRSALRRLRTGILPVPGQAAGLTAIVAVLAAALVSVSLMLGSAKEGAWERERARHAESALGATMHSFSLPRDASPAGEIVVPTPTRFARAGAGVRRLQISGPDRYFRERCSCDGPDDRSSVVSASV